MSGSIIVLGGGGHAKVLISTLLQGGDVVVGFTDPDEGNRDILGVPRLGDNEKVLAYPPAEVFLVNGLGSTGSTERRKKLYEKFKAQGFIFATIQHASAVLAPEVEVGEGGQIMAGAVIQSGSRIAENVIVNTGVVVDHDCMIEAHVHLAPGVVLSGGVFVGEGAHVGTGASVIQGVRIGRNSVVGAGAVVVRDVPDETVVVGVPAKSIEL